jgi:hypothetical protein
MGKKKKDKKVYEAFAPLEIEWVGQGAEVKCIVKGKGCDCRVDVVVGIVDVMDTEEQIANLTIESGKLVIKAMTEIFETHINNPVILAISAMAWVKQNTPALTQGWRAALTEANEKAKVTPATIPEGVEFEEPSDPESEFIEFLKGRGRHG